MKKLLTLVVCSLLAICTVSAKDIASGTFKNGGSWKISEQGELYVDAVTIPDYKTTSLESGPYYVINIDNDIDGYYYHRWHTSAPWNSYMPQIKTLRLSSSVKTIGTEAFAHLNLLTKVTIEGSGIIIKDDAFNGCFRLYDFPFASGKITSIGHRAFVHCAFLTIELNGVTYIGYYAFDQCYRLWRRPQDQSIGNYSIKVTGAFPTVEEMHDYSSGVVGNENFLATDGHTILTQTRTRVEKGSKLIVVSDTKSSGAFSSNGVGEVVMGGDGWRFSYGTLTVTSQQLPYNSASDAPWYAKRNNVTYLSLKARHIPANLFMNYTALETVNLPEDVVSIGDNAFNGCTNLTKVVNLDKVKSIGAVAFANTKLNPVLILNSAETIGNSAFDNVTTIVQLILGENLTSIGAYAFRNTLQSHAGSCWIKVAGAAPNTASNAFDGVLTRNLAVPAGVYASYNGKSPWTQFNIETIVDFPVTGTNPTWELTWDGTLTILGSVPNYTNESDQPWFPYKNYIKKVVFGSNVTIVGNNALSYTNENESKITNVEIPASVTEIGENAFKNNDQIEEVKAEGVQTIGNQAFENCSSLEKVKFGKDLSSIGDKAFNYCGLIDAMAVKAAVPPAVTAQTFVGLGRMSSNAPAKAKAKYAARRATSATGQKAVNLDVPDDYIAKYLAVQYWNLFSFEYIGEHGGIVRSGQYYDGVWVIYEDGTLIASSETSTGTIDGFYNQPGVTRVELMGGATELNWTGFGPADLPNLEEVVLSPAMHKLGNEVFKNSTKLKSINLENVDSIGMECFKGCTSLTSVDLSVVKFIDNSAFESCTGLTEVNMSGAFTLRPQAFKDCSSLAKVSMSGMPNAEAGAFQGCTALADVTMSGRAIQIKSSLFSGCSALQSIELGDECWGVNSSAFASTGINKIYSASPKPPVLASDAFGSKSLGTITAYVPADYMNAYHKADVWRKMNLAVDPRYGEPALPTGGSMGETGIWELDETGALTIDCEGRMPLHNDFGGSASTERWYKTFDRWIGFIENVRYSDNVTRITMDVTDKDASEGTYDGIKTLEIGTNVDTILSNAMRYTGLTDVYCFAPEPPVVTTGENGSFDRDALIANGTTLHVVVFPGTLAKYQASSRWNWFPNIVADLPTRKEGVIYVENVKVTSAEGTWFNVQSSELGSKTVQLAAEVYPANANDKSLVWTSSDNSVATVDANGLVTIIGYPSSTELTITATAADGSNRKNAISLRIINPANDWGSVLCQGMDVNRRTITITKSQKPVDIVVSLTPANSSANIEFDVENSSMLQVEAEYDVASSRRTGVFHISAPDPMMVPEIQLGSTTIHFHTHYYDETLLGTDYPSVCVNVNIIEDVTFTENSKEGVPVTYRVESMEDKTCLLHGKFVESHDDPELGWVDWYYETAIDKNTTGTVTIPSKVRNFYVEGVDYNAFAECTAVEELDFMEGIKYVSAVNSCTALKTLRLPSSIKELGSNCGANLNALKDVHLLAPVPPVGMNGMDITSTNAFAGLTNATLHVAAGCRNIYNVAPWNVWFTSIVEDGEAVDNFVASYVCDFTAAASKHSNYNDTWTYDTDWSVFGGANNNGGWAYAKFGGKSTTLANANPVYVANQYAFGREIKAIRVTFPSGSFGKSGMSCNDWGVKVYSDLACTQLLYTVTGEAIAANGCTLTLAPEAGQVWKAGYGFRVYWNLANTSSTNGIVLVDKIEYLTDAEDNRPVWPMYTVRFLDWNGTVLQEGEIREGFTPAYAGETPVRPMDTEYIYTFTGWDPALVAATADADYTAQYSTEERFPGGTGIEEIFTRPDAPAAVKILHNGILYIIRPDGAIYNATGLRVR